MTGMNSRNYLSLYQKRPLQDLLFLQSGFFFVIYLYEYVRVLTILADILYTILHNVPNSEI